MDRLLPHSAEAERYVLGGIFRWPQMLPDVSLMLCPEDFYVYANGVIFGAMEETASKGKPVDTVNVANCLKENNSISNTISGSGDVSYEYLATLWDNAGSGAGVVSHAEIVRDHSLRRQLAVTSAEINRDALSPTGPTSELVQAAEKKLFLISERGIRETSIPLVDAMRDACDRIDTPDLDTSYLPSGFLDLDRLIGGLHASELILIAARPSVGKTSLALGIMRNVVKEGEPLLFCSIEQRYQEIADRLLCCEGLVDSHSVRTKRLQPEEVERIREARNRLMQAGELEIFDAPRQTMTTIAAQVRRQRSKLGIKAVFIDYLQLIEPDDRRAPRHEQVGGISRQLKWLAREVNLPVVALAQLNRETEHRADPRPRLSDLRDSGELEQNADTVLLLNQSKEQANVLEIDVAKQRNGRRGQMLLTVKPECYRYENHAPDF